jgi:hypothetical protein
MQPVKIIVRGGEARQVIDPVEDAMLPLTSRTFAAPGIPDGTYMARLQEQYLANNQTPNWQNGPNPDSRNKTRQIWVLSPDVEGDKKEEVSQVFYIYCYDSIRGWVKLPSNPKHGYGENEIKEMTLKAKQQAEKYPGKEFTIMGIITKFTI